MHALLSLVVVLSAAPKAAGTPDAEPSLNLLASFSALPASFDSQLNPSTDAKIELGRMLFYDTRLSKNHDVSCNSCHDLQHYGVDGKAFSTGHKKQLGNRNSPSVYNAGGHVAQFWDGRAADLEEQAKGPVMNPIEMASVSQEKVVQTLRSIPQYVALFKKAFPDQNEPVSFENMARAIGSFERRLVTPSRFDKYLKGDKAALTVVEKKGLTLFVETGCIACHSGAGVGGGAFQKVGLVEPWPDVGDPGRFSVTKVESDRMFFRVPGLRNVEKTAPYFHNGKVATLEEAVQMMARYQLGRKLTDGQTASIVAFLKSLTGEIPASYIKSPKLPSSTQTTPAPDPS